MGSQRSSNHSSWFLLYARLCRHAHICLCICVHVCGPPGRASREATGALAALPERLAAEQRAAYEAVLAALRGELRRATDGMVANESAALARLDARLGVRGSSMCVIMYHAWW